MVKRHTNFGNSVSGLLTERQLTQKQLGELMGKSPVYTSHVMRGYRTASASYVDMVADVLNLNPADRQKLHYNAALDHGFKLDLTKK